MITKSWVVTIIAIQASLQVAASKGWSYEGSTGPANWYKTNPTCAGKRQSPINIKTAKAKFHEEYIETDGYNKEKNDITYELANNGHSSQVTLSNVPSSVALSVFGDDFKPWQFHFHWGKTDDVGSEHKLNGVQFAAEMHFVHVNKKYANTDEALANGDGLLVLGTFIEVCNEGNELFDDLVRNFRDIENKDEKVKIDAIPLDAIMPENADDFYYYKGSLTTPGCNESVLWVVYRDTLCISPEQIETFRRLKKSSLKSSHGEGGFLFNNFRPVQKLNGRKVYKNFK